MTVHNQNANLDSRRLHLPIQNVNGSNIAADKALPAYPISSKETFQTPSNGTFSTPGNPDNPYKQTVIVKRVQKTVQTHDLRDGS